jgi:hypothetical protein
MRLRPRGLLLALALLASVPGVWRPGGPASAATLKTYVYWDQNEQEDFAVEPSGTLGRLVPPWDPNGQMCIFPGGGGRFVTGYNPTLPGQHNPGSKKPLMNPPVGEAVWDRHGHFTGKTIYVPGPYHLKGSNVGGDIPPDKTAGNTYNNNGTFTGCVFDSMGHLFAADIGTAQGKIPVPDNGRLIEWFGPKYTTYCILFGPTSGGRGPHHVDGTGGLADPGTMARDSHGNIYVPEPGHSSGTGFPDGGRVLEFMHSSFPASAASCPGPSNMPKRKVQRKVFIQGGSQGFQQVPSGIARDPSCRCWAVTSVVGSPAIAWYKDDGSPYAGKGPVPAGDYSPFGIAVAPDGTTYFADIHVQPCSQGFCTTDGQAAIYKVTFTNGVPNPPAAVGTGYSFPVGVTVCVPSRQVCPKPRV